MWKYIYIQYEIYSVKNILGYDTICLNLRFTVIKIFLRIAVFLLYTVSPEIAELFQHCQDESSFIQ